jgi:hypothetical protein
MNHAYYNSDFEAFLSNSDDEIVGKLNKAGTAFASQWTNTTTSWDNSINILKESFRELLEHNNLAEQIFLLNAYRVLLTRAREGIVIFVPEGDSEDETRLPQFYNAIYDYLKGCGLEVI